MDGAFFRAANMVLNATDIPDLSRVTSLRHMFNGAGKFSGHASMSHWDVGHITNMNGMFYGSGFRSGFRRLEHLERDQYEGNVRRIGNV